MINVFSPAYYFDLEGFAHAALFDNCAYVWEPLALIHNYLKTRKLGQIEVDVPAGAYLINPELISIGKNSVIEPGAYIAGPCVIGENCTVRHGAYIRGDLITGDRCVIGHDTEIKNAVLLNGAHAAHFAYVGDSILGNNVNLGAGTKCANFKFDGSEVIIHHEGQRLATGRRKFGAIIGDKSQMGCNSVSNPGSLIGQNVRVFPCINCSGIIPTGSTISNRILT